MARSYVGRPAGEASGVARERIGPIVERLAAEHADATIALRFSSDLDLLVSVMLSAQTTDANVNRVTERLFRKYRRPEDYLAVPAEELERDIYATGFFRQKTKSIRGAMRVLLEEFDGQVPRTLAELLRLPGVARKTANVVAAELGHPQGIVVDTHVRRLSQRLGLTRNEDPVKIERDLAADRPARGLGEVPAPADLARAARLRRATAALRRVRAERPLSLGARCDGTGAIGALTAALYSLRHIPGTKPARSRHRCADTLVPGHRGAPGGGCQRMVQGARRYLRVGPSAARRARVPAERCSSSAYRGGDTTWRAAATACDGSPTTTTVTASPRPTSCGRSPGAWYPNAARARRGSTTTVSRPVVWARTIAAAAGQSSSRLLERRSHERRDRDGGHRRQGGEAQRSVRDRDEPDACGERDAADRDRQRLARVDGQEDAGSEHRTSGMATRPATSAGFQARAPSRRGRGTRGPRRRDRRPRGSSRTPGRGRHRDPRARADRHRRPHRPGRPPPRRGRDRIRRSRCRPPGGRAAGRPGGARRRARRAGRRARSRRRDG